jgi:hypothetical protein
MVELIVGLAFGAVFSAGLLVLGFQIGWKLRDKAGSIAGERHIGPIVEAELGDPIVINGFDAVEPE